MLRANYVRAASSPCEKTFEMDLSNYAKRDCKINHGSQRIIGRVRGQELALYRMKTSTNLGRAEIFLQTKD